MKKKLIKVIISLSLVCLLTACGNEEQGSGKEINASTTVKDTSIEEASTTLVDDDETTLDEEIDSGTSKITNEVETTTVDETTTLASKDTNKLEQAATQETTTPQTSANTQTPSIGQDIIVISPEEETEAPTLSDYELKKQRLVNEAVSEAVKPGMSELEKALAIHDWIICNIDYDYENYLANTIPSSSTDTVGALETRIAVCAGYACCFYDMAIAAGLEVDYVTGCADGNKGTGYEGHAWNQVKIDGKWYNVDTTWGESANASSDPFYHYFLISDSRLYKDHIADSKTHVCSSDYDRWTILDVAENNGFHGNVVAVTPDIFVEKIRSFCEKKISGEFTIWYYDEVVECENIHEKLNDLLMRAACPMSYPMSFADGIAFQAEKQYNTKLQIDIDLNVLKEIKSITSYEELIAYAAENDAKGITEFYIRDNIDSGVFLGDIPGYAVSNVYSHTVMSYYIVTKKIDDELITKIDSYEALFSLAAENKAKGNEIFYCLINDSLWENMINQDKYACADTGYECEGMYGEANGVVIKMTKVNN